MPQRRLWLFLRNPRNLAILVALGGAIGFLWKEIAAPALNKPAVVVAPAPVVPPAQVATATEGGVAVNASGEAHVSVNSPPPKAP